jgi:hypothetical protein
MINYHGLVAGKNNARLSKTNKLINHDGFLRCLPEPRHILQDNLGHSLHGNKKTVYFEKVCANIAFINFVGIKVQINLVNIAI